MPYPKRIIEVDLPIRRISTHARREKSIRHGHISTLHIWWARRPLAACRAVLCAALYPDPADPYCPADFIETARKEMQAWADDRLKKLSLESRQHFNRYRNDPSLLSSPVELRHALLDFIADFANWDSSTDEDYLNTARTLTQAAHEALGGEAGSRPLVVDPFAGGGSIPLEALRVGADAFASDLNPIPVLINKVQLEYIPRYGKKLAEEVRKWGKWIKEQAENEMAKFYPSLKDPQPSYYLPQLEPTLKKQGKNWELRSIVKETPIAYLWARTITCEGPSCGAAVPLMRSKWIAKTKKRSIALEFKAKKNTLEIELTEKFQVADADEGTVKRGSATCPCCGYTTPVVSVRRQLKARRGGANDARMTVVVTSLQTEREFNGVIETVEETGRYYRLPVASDLNAFFEAGKELEKRIAEHKGELSLVPDEPTPMGGGTGAGRAFSQRNYGMNLWSDIFSRRQLLTLNALQKQAQVAASNNLNLDTTLRNAIRTCLALCISRQSDYSSSLCSWHLTGEKIGHTFGRQAIPMIWDYTEVNPFSTSSGNFIGALEWISLVLEKNFTENPSGQSNKSDATKSVLPDDFINIWFTDPPYYDAVPYSDLSDFFYVWIKRILKYVYPGLFSDNLTNKDDECILDEIKGKDNAYFVKTMQKALSEGRRVTKPGGIGIVVFAHNSTVGWEAQLQAMIEAGWYFTASWSIDTEMGSRLRAMDSAALASSIHLVCRPREKEDGTLITDSVGDWREVLRELPKRIHEWMPRLAADGVVGADAIFACLGPALEIFSRYSSVEKPNGEQVTLREYLEQVWGAVSQEALGMVFQDADVRGFEEDARLTAMWLWTLNQGDGSLDTIVLGEEDDEDEEGNGKGKAPKLKGFTLEYDTARKISQGLGVRLESLGTLVHYKGDKARLLPVEERMSDLFGIEKAKQPVVKKRQPKEPTLFDTLPEWEEPKAVEFPEPKLNGAVKTTLDRLHTAMLLFGTGRTDALKRFLVESGAGSDERFWKLAQALNALYPKNTDERRWVEAVQTYKKSLGF